MFWLIGGARDVLARVVGAFNAQPPLLSIEWDRAQRLQMLTDRILRPQSTRTPHIAGEAEPIDPTTYSPMTLTIRDEQFAPDFLPQHAWFVSKRLREVMQLDRRVAQYLPVKTEGSHRNALAQDYRMMHPHAVRDALDPHRSDVEYIEQGDAVPPQVVSVKKFVWREDFVADVPIFRDQRDQRFFATDAFAERVLRAGITDMVFQDIFSERGQHEVVLKTL